MVSKYNDIDMHWNDSFKDLSQTCWKGSCDMLTYQIVGMMMALQGIVVVLEVNFDGWLCSHHCFLLLYYVTN